MSWCSEYADRLEPDAPLAELTWFRVGGRARYLYRPRDAEELASFMVRATHEGADVRILGGGANVLVRDDGVDGVVVRLEQPAFHRVKLTGATAEVGAGVDLGPQPATSRSRIASRVMSLLFVMVISISAKVRRTCQVRRTYWPCYLTVRTHSW